MLSHEAPHPNWEDLLKALKLVELYDRINNGTCGQATLTKLYDLSANEPDYDDPADYVRYVIYPQFMDSIGCTSGYHKIGLGSFINYIWDYSDADQFFDEMATCRTMRTDRIEIAELMCKDDADQYLKYL